MLGQGRGIFVEKKARVQTDGLNAMNKANNARIHIQQSAKLGGYLRVTGLLGSEDGRSS